MLHFQGIRTNRFGAPERFSLRFDIPKSLEVIMVIYHHFDGQKTPVLDSIEQSLSEHFSQKRPANLSTFDYRKTTALWMRAKDMAHFLFCDASLVALKAQIFQHLLDPRSIQDKWSLLRDILIQHLLQMSALKSQELLLDPNSEFHRILDCISLFFLDQDPEQPPQNLELEFLPHQFPARVWKKNDFFSNHSAPFWHPKNQLCNPLALEQLILERIYEEKMIQLNQKVEIITEQAPTGVASLRFADEATNLLIPQSPTETLLALQKEVQRQFSYEGAKHLLAILQQLSKTQQDRFEFSLDAHFDLLGKMKRDACISSRQSGLFMGVLDLLGKIIVVRTVESTTTENPLLTKWTQKANPQVLGTIELILDPLVRLLGLGKHLKWIPREVFLENPQTHGLVPGLVAFLCGWWQIEFSEKKGTYQCKGEHLINAFVLQKSTSQKVHFLNRIKEELHYMLKRNYISHFQVDQNPNPLEAQFQITAPTRLLQKWAVSPSITT